MVSVVIVCYRRLAGLEGILAAWLKQTPDIWLADCTGGRFKTKLPIKHIIFNPDPGNRARHALALLTQGRLVIKADDDVLPGPGLIQDFLKAYNFGGPAIYGLIGRRFLGPKYYGQTQFFKSATVEELTEVDFCGVVTMSPRDFLAFDLNNCSTAIEDLYWQMWAFPTAKKFVIPTKHYSNLAEANDKGCLFHDLKAREIRESFYREHFLNNYQSEGRTKWTPKPT